MVKILFSSLANVFNYRARCNVDAKLLWAIKVYRNKIHICYELTYNGFSRYSSGSVTVNPTRICRLYGCILKTSRPQKMCDSRVRVSHRTCWRKHKNRFNWQEPENDKNREKRKRNRGPQSGRNIYSSGLAVCRSYCGQK